MCFCVLLSVVLHGSPHGKSTRYYERIYVQSQTYLCDFVCVFEGESEREGFIALFFYARDGMNLRVCVCVCVCACVRV